MGEADHAFAEHFQDLDALKAFMTGVIDPMGEHPNMVESLLPAEVAKAIGAHSQRGDEEERQATRLADSFCDSSLYVTLCQQAEQEETDARGHGYFNDAKTSVENLRTPPVSSA